MKNRSVDNHSFARVPQVTVPRSVFNRSSAHKTTFDAGYLIPIWVDSDILPGDTMNMKFTILLRLLSASFRPFMDNLWADIFSFFVPHRHVWTNFKRFMGEQDNPADSISFTVPQITGPNVAGGGIPIGHLYDYMGVPTGALSGGGATTGITFNNLLGRAYNLTWNTWFRDINLQNSVVVDVDDGPDTFTDYNLLKRGKRHDYFTSCLPFVQRGTAVQLSLGTSATVKTAGAALVSGAQNPLKLLDVTGAVPTTNRNLVTGPGADSIHVFGDTAGGLALGSGLLPSNLFADLTTAIGPTVNSLRDSIALQQYLETSARGGSRYIEIVKAFFGVTSPDARQSRPEILSVHSGPVKIIPVPNQSDTSAALGSSSLGTLAAFGTGIQSGLGFTKSFTEHGSVLILLAVRADLSYSQGLDRMWSRRTRYDFYWNQFATLGEQAVLNKEIFANVADGSGASGKDGVFGYIPRYDDMRFKNSKITGKLRPGVAGSLQVWHLAQEFSALPTLGNTFIQDDPPVDRVITTPSEPHFILDAFFDLKHARPMPVFSVPGLTKL